VLFNAFEMRHFPQCLSYISQVYSPSVRKQKKTNKKNIHSTVRRGRAFCKWI